MRAEIVITCRNEMPENLRRTVQNINATKGPDDIVTVVLDGPHDDVAYRYDARTLCPFPEWQGPGRCRDYAITHSRAKYIIMVDGHMTFPAGWVDEICAHLFMNPNDITCCRMQGLGQRWEVLAEEIHHGCYLALIHPHESMKNWWICSHWNSGEPTDRGVTGGIMGACYGITRGWYERIGSPLAILRGWGGDEELLSVCSWLMGGRCYLLPPICGHIWAAKRQRPEVDYHEKWEMWANHYAMLDALPVPELEYAIMKQHLNIGNTRNDIMVRLVGERHKEIQHLRKTLDKSQRNWQWLKKNGVIRL